MLLLPRPTTTREVRRSRAWRTDRDALTAGGAGSDTPSRLDGRDTVVDNGTVTVHLSDDVSLPFGRVIALLVPGHADGRAHVDVTSHAQSPLTEPGGC